ncbi:MAG: protein kinase [Planctomycetaceae bacterium]
MADTIAFSDSLTPELQSELQSAQECLRLLEQKWPRSDAADDHNAFDQAAAQWGSSSSIPPALNRFEIQRKLGHGGFGVVFLAFDSVLHRQVALKLPRPDRYLTPAIRRRFLREARAAASLKHPNIVAVYDAGEVGPLCYIAQAFCEGPTLSRWLLERTVPVPPRLGAKLVQTLAEAVAYAHSHGVLHRDLKPGNVLLESDSDSSPQDPRVQGDEFNFIPKLTDFGLAKLSQAESTASESAVFGGTTQYMAPEQTQGLADQFGPHTDVYALGVILYELLAGRTPFEGLSVVETLHRVVSDEPPRPRSLRADLPRDLESICLKCLEKSPSQRYQTADALVDDLRRFLAGEPTHARPIGPTRHALKWARRRPALSALIATIALAVIGIVGGSWWHAVQLQSSLDANVEIRIEAEQLRDSALEQKSLAEDRERSVRHYLYAGDMRLAFTAWKNSNVAEMNNILERHGPGPGAEDLRNFVWHYLWRLSHAELRTFAGHRGDVHCVAFSPDGKRFATASGDGTAKLWDAGTGNELAILKSHEGELNSVAFSPDGTILATCGDDRTIRLWDAAGGQILSTLLGHSEAVFAVSFSPDGRILASGGREHTVRLWDVSTGKQSGLLTGHSGGIEAIAFSPDGKLLSTGSGDKSAIIWDVAAKKPRSTLAGSGQIVLSVAFAHDGRTIAAAGEDRAITLWDVETGRQKNTLQGHGEIVQSIAFSPDDQSIAAAVKDGTVWLWDASAGRVLRTIRGHAGRVWFVVFSPDGKTLATAGSDQTARFWGVDDDRATHVVSGPRGCFVLSLTVAPHGKNLAVAFYHNRQIGSPELRLFQIDANRINRLENWLSGPHGVVAYSPDARWLAVARGNNNVEFYDVQAMRLSATVNLPSILPGSFSSIAWSPDSRTLAVVAPFERRVSLLDVNGVERAKLAGPDNTDLLNTVGFSPNGTTLAAGTDHGDLTIWNTSPHQAETSEYKTIKAHEVGICGLAFSPDGQSLATCCPDGTLRIWNSETLLQQATLQGHTQSVNSVAFCPDGKTFASGSNDGTVRLWDTFTWQELITLEAHQGGVTQIAFTADGRTLVSGGTAADGKGEIAIWRTTSLNAARTVK